MTIVNNVEPVVDENPLYNSRIIQSYVKFIRKNYSHINISDLLAHARMEPYQVEDQAHWFTQSQVDRFYEMLISLTNNENIAREAGRYATTQEATGLMRPYILSQIGPVKVYEIIGKVAPKLTRSSTFESKKLGPSKIEIVVSPKEGVNEKKYQCDNRIGYFEAVALAFKSRLPKVEHPECQFKGGKVCRYVISWQNAKSFFFNKPRNYAFLLLFALLFPVFIFYSKQVFVLYTLTSIVVLLFLTLISKSYEEQQLHDTVEDIKECMDKMLKSINTNYDIALFTNEIGIALSKEIDLDITLQNVVDILEKRLDYDRGMILLSNSNKSMLVYKTGFGYNNQQLNILKNASFNIDKPSSEAVFVVSYQKKIPYIVDDIEEIKDKITSRSYDFARSMGTKSFICVPIIHENDTLGLLVVDNVNTKRPLIQSDVNLLMGIAPQIGISIRNAMLLHSKLQQFNSILFVLAASIDARDFLTAGHSEKVTEYSVGICGELGLSLEYTEMLRIAALLHDYGKIGVPDSVLKKNGALDPKEYQQIQSHAEKTRNILEKISFEGLFTQIPEIAGSHHERLNGSGYPGGLKGEEIPLGAKIIAVADFFEAITAKRHYREPMPVDKAMSLLKQEGDKGLDKELIEAFVRYYLKRYGWSSSKN